MQRYMTNSEITYCKQKKKITGTFRMLEIKNLYIFQGTLTKITHV